MNPARYNHFLCWIQNTCPSTVNRIPTTVPSENDTWRVTNSKSLSNTKLNQQWNRNIISINPWKTQKQNSHSVKMPVSTSTIRSLVILGYIMVPSHPLGTHGGHHATMFPAAAIGGQLIFLAPGGYAWYVQPVDDSWCLPTVHCWIWSSFIVDKFNDVHLYCWLLLTILARLPFIHGNSNYQPSWLGSTFPNQLWLVGGSDAFRKY